MSSHVALSAARFAAAGVTGCSQCALTSPLGRVSAAFPRLRLAPKSRRNETHWSRLHRSAACWARRGRDPPGRPARRHERLVDSVRDRHDARAAPSCTPTAAGLRAASNLRAWMHGTHRGVSAQHLPVYLGEFVFRHNRRGTPMAPSRRPRTQHQPPTDRIPRDGSNRSRDPEPTGYALARKRQQGQRSRLGSSSSATTRSAAARENGASAAAARTA